MYACMYKGKHKYKGKASIKNIHNNDNNNNNNIHHHIGDKCKNIMEWENNMAVCYWMRRK